jgi:hypothetical protein
MGREQGAWERRKARFFLHLLRIKKLIVKIIHLKGRGIGGRVFLIN